MRKTFSYYSTIFVLGPLLTIVFISACSKEGGSGRVEVHYEELIPTYPYRASDFSVPVTSAHRGTPHIPGYPENSMESARYLDQYKPIMLEVDVRQSVDGELVLFHDDNLERLTTGLDQMNKFDIDELQQLLLKDQEGNITNFHIPTLRKLLHYNKTRQSFTLFLDIKKGTSYKKVAEMIREKEQEKNTILIVYSLSAAFALHQIIPEAVLSIPVRNLDEWSRLKESGFPLDRVIAFTGTIRSEEGLIDSLLAYDIAPIMGVMGNIDKQAEVKGDKVYKELTESGIKILATDRPLDVFNWLSKDYYENYE